MSRHRYRSFDGGPDPLAPPFDAGAAVDELAEHIMSGASVSEALGRLWEEGLTGDDGLARWRREIAQRRGQLRRSGRLDGLLSDITRMLDEALTAERAALFADPSDDARFREAALDNLPDSTAGAVRELRNYDWQSPQAAEAFSALQDRLRRDVLDQQFSQLSASLRETPTPQQEQAVQAMLEDLNALLDTHRRGDDTADAYRDFLDRHGQFFPDAPETFEEFIDELARRAAAAQRLLDSLTDDQRAELADLMAQALDPQTANQMSQLRDHLEALRPELAWAGRQRMSGEQPLSLPDATQALADLADLDALTSQLADSARGADPADIDEELVARQLGRSAADELEALRRIAEQLREQGFVSETMHLTPKAIRRIGATALRRVFADLDAGRRGDHDTVNTGAAGELVGSTRPWQFGDSEPLDVVRTLANALQRHRGTEGIELAPADFEVRETESRTRTAVALCVDQSFSMVTNDTWQAAKTTALALHALASAAYPSDAVEIITFGNLARTVTPDELPDLAAAQIQGTNLHHALMLAGRFLDRHRDAQPLCLVITDGEPTAYLLPDGDWWFNWPPDPPTVAAAVAEVDKLTRRGVRISWFRLGDEPRLAAFVDAMARRNGGRVLSPEGSALGRYVVNDYVRGRRGR